MKLSVSLRDDDVKFIDEFAASAGYSSRSAVVQKALGLLRAGDLVSAYEDAFGEWSEGGHDLAWSVDDAEGLDDASR